MNQRHDALFAAARFILKMANVLLQTVMNFRYEQPHYNRRESSAGELN
jgi:hypothetical protein